MARLVSCRAVGNVSIKRCDELKVLLIGNVVVRLTAKEYLLLLQLLESNISSDSELMERMYTTDMKEAKDRQKMDKHVDNVKLKLASTDLSIRRVRRSGYALRERLSASPPKEGTS